MIDVKEAVKNAVDFMQNVLEEEKLHDLALEEVRLSDDEQYWYVTLGFTRHYTIPINSEDAFAQLKKVIASEKVVREYKSLKVQAENGKVMSMEIRTI